MADRQYKPLGNVSAPADWTLPGNLELLVKRAFAHFDGTAAGGSFLPTLQVLDDAGRTVLEVPQDAAVAAGSSVEASWAPFLRSVQASTPSGGATAPSIATFYRSTSLGDPAQSVAAGADAKINWLHAALPSDGTITGPDAFHNANFVGACVTLEMLRTSWEIAAFPRAGVLSTQSRIVQADAYAFDNNGAAGLGADGTSEVWTSQWTMNAHLDGDNLSTFVTNGDAAARDLNKAFLVIYRWDAPTYAGGIPGYPP